MADLETWIDIGSLEDVSAAPLQRMRAQGLDFAVSYVDGRVGVVSNVCNHVGGCWARGCLDGYLRRLPIGITGNSIVDPVPANPASSRIFLASRLMR